MIKIGVTGTFCSGKDSFADYLIRKGYEHISLSDILRDELKKMGKEVTLQNLIDLGNEMRKNEGNNVLAKKAIEKMDKEKNYVVTSIRNPLEVKELSNSKNFVLVNIHAPVEIRFNRVINRGRRESEPATIEEFKIIEEKQLNSDDESNQKIQDCIDMAKFTIVNDSNIEEFHRRIDEEMQKIKDIVLFKRLGWDEYFIDIMRKVGQRGTCDRGRAGSIIVKDKRIMTTGYVGAPPGLAHCDDIGHWFKKTIHEDKSVTQHCIRTVHAESNAIAQAAKFGINIEGATLYVKMEPCLDCTKLLISAGIKRVVCEKRYHAGKESREMLEEAGIKLKVLDETILKYDGQ